MRDLRPIHLYVLAVILVHTMGHFAYMGLWRHLTAADFDVNDFKAYYTAGLALRTGQADTFLYSDPERLNLGLLPSQPWVDFAVKAGIPHPSAYIYPPFFAILVAPLTLLPYHAANLVWFGINLLLLAASVWMLVRLGGGGAGAHGLLPAATVIFVSLNFYPTIRAMQCGQAGLVLLFLTAAALGALMKGRDALAGLCLAIASAIKLTPIILILYLAWMGRRRAAAWGAALVGGLTLLSITVAGWENHVIYMTEFLPYLSRGAATYANQSMNGFLNRLLTDQSMSIFDFSREPASVWLLTRAAAALLLGAAFLAARQARAAPHQPAGLDLAGERGLALGYSLVVLTSVLASPISWEHHYLLALIPLAIMIREAANSGSLGLVATLAIAYTAMAVDAFEFVRRQLPRGTRPAMSFVLYGGLLLWCLMALALARARRGQAAESQRGCGA